MKRIWLLFLVAVLGFLAGCAGGGGGYGRDINDPTNSLVFGYVDMADAPTKINSATLQQVAPPSDKPFWHTNANNGLFHIAYMPPGSYQLATLRGSGFWSGDVRYNFPRQGTEQAVRITKPGIYFLGSYKYKGVKSGLFEPSKFDVERVNTPTEAELLRRILEDKEIKGSAWEAKIRQRLSQLK
jgi:hypothetical protein